MQDFGFNLYTTGDAARVLGCTHQWVRKLIDRGELEVLRTPLGYLINPESVTRYERRKVDALARRGRVTRYSVAQ